MKRFLSLEKNFNAQKIATAFAAKKEAYWLARGEQMALQLFREMSVRVPAYKDFLAKHKVNPKKIKTIQDFKTLPTLDKNNYLRAYARKDLCWDGQFDKQNWVISTTSGSTGEPYYFPRQDQQDAQYALTAELYLRTNFKIHQRSTLYVVAFPMGAWIGGLFTYEALKIISEKPQYKLSIITPGINKAEVIKAVKSLGHEFDQVIIGSYGPFLKDFIDDGEREGLDWKKHKLGFVFSAEGFSEVFRDYVAQKTGLKNVCLDTLNHYGTVDLGTMSYETPISILSRRLALQNEGLYEGMFNQAARLPTLTQYSPEMFYFEDAGTLLCSAHSGIPLVRYDLKDHGGIFTLSQLKAAYKNHGLNFKDEVKKAGIEGTVWNLPFVYVYERNDFSVSYYAFQIYPETIRKALQHQSVHEKITGKFTMQVQYDKAGSQEFEINVELKPDVAETAKLRKHLQSLVVESLLTDSSEYRKTHEEYGEGVYPKLVFWPYEDATYFKVGTKQKWVKK